MCTHIYSSFNFSKERECLISIKEWLNANKEPSQQIPLYMSSPQRRLSQILNKLIVYLFIWCHLFMSGKTFLIDPSGYLQRKAIKNETANSSRSISNDVRSSLEKLWPLWWRLVSLGAEEGIKLIKLLLSWINSDLDFILPLLFLLSLFLV